MAYDRFFKRKHIRVLRVRAIPYVVTCAGERGYEQTAAIIPHSINGHRMLFVSAFPVEHLYAVYGHVFAGQQGIVGIKVLQHHSIARIGPLVLVVVE